jgi:hypothetical protein
MTIDNTFTWMKLITYEHNGWYLACSINVMVFIICEGGEEAQGVTSHDS